jgi:hypothetical protein
VHLLLQDGRPLHPLAGPPPGVTYAQGFGPALAPLQSIRQLADAPATFGTTWGGGPAPVAALQSGGLFDAGDTASLPVVFGASSGPSFSTFDGQGGGLSSSSANYGLLEPPRDFSAAAKTALSRVNLALLPPPLRHLMSSVLLYLWSAAQGRDGDAQDTRARITRTHTAALRVFQHVAPGQQLAAPRASTSAATFIVKFISDVVARLESGSPTALQPSAVADLVSVLSSVTEGGGGGRLGGGGGGGLLPQPTFAPSTAAPTGSSASRQPTDLAPRSQPRLAPQDADVALLSALTDAFYLTPWDSHAPRTPDQEQAVAWHLAAAFEGGRDRLPFCIQAGSTLPQAVFSAIAPSFEQPPFPAEAALFRPFLVALAHFLFNSSSRGSVQPVCNWLSFRHAALHSPTISRSASHAETVAYASHFFDAVAGSSGIGALVESSVVQLPRDVRAIEVADESSSEDESTPAAPRARHSAGESSSGESAYVKYLSSLEKQTFSRTGSAQVHGENDRAASTHRDLAWAIMPAPTVDLRDIPFHEGPRREYSHTRLYPPAYRPLAEQAALVRNSTRDAHIITGFTNSFIVAALRVLTEEGLHIGFGISGDAMFPNGQFQDLAGGASGYHAFIVRWRRVIGELASRAERLRPKFLSIPAPTPGTVGPCLGAFERLEGALLATLTIARARWPNTSFEWLLSMLLCDLVFSDRAHTMLHVPLIQALEIPAANAAMQGGTPPSYFNYAAASPGSFNPLARTPELPTTLSASAAVTSTPRESSGRHVRVSATAHPELTATSEGLGGRKRGRRSSIPSSGTPLRTAAGAPPQSAAPPRGEAAPDAPWFLRHPDTARPEHCCPVCGPDNDHYLHRCPRVKAYRSSPGAAVVPSFADMPVGTTYSQFLSKNASRAPQRQ